MHQRASTRSRPPKSFSIYGSQVLHTTRVSSSTPERLQYTYQTPVSEYRDAGQAFYATDFWSLWDIGTIAIGLAFFITSEFSLCQWYQESLLLKSE